MAARLAVGLHQADRLPVAYGTDKHDDYFDEMAEKHREGKLPREEALHLREELEAMEARGAAAEPQGAERALKDELVARLADDARLERRGDKAA